VAERATVARITGVRFSPFALEGIERMNKKLDFTFALREVKQNKEVNKMKIIFICKYNAFRSRVAEEYFEKINKNSKIKTISRGFIMGGNSDSEQRKISKKLLGINIAKRKPLPIKIQELKEADLIIVVANDIPKIMFNYQNAPLQKKLIIWKVKDEQKRNKSNINNIVLQIKERVENLNKTLEKLK
jgi:protein-tyrosine-phosphatase